MWERIRIIAMVATLFITWFAVVTMSLGGQLWPLLASVR
jgi:hypothetical protein